MGKAGATSAAIRISVRVLLILVSLLFSVMPAVVWWYVEFSSVKEGVNSVFSAACDAIKVLSGEMQASISANATYVLVSLIEPTETAIAYTVGHLKGLGIQSLSGTKAASDFYNNFQVDLQYTISANEYMTSALLSLYYKPTKRLNFCNASTVSQASSLSSNATPAVYQFCSIGKLNINPLTNDLLPQILLGLGTVNLAVNSSVIKYFLFNQTTGKPETLLFSYPHNCIAWEDFDFAQKESISWMDGYEYNSYTGIPQIVLNQIVPFKDQSAYFEVGFYTSIYEVSSIFQNLLASHSEDRLYLFFRTTQGMLIAASHGKFFSHSDFDFSRNNPLINPPPPVGEYQWYTPLNSTDVVILASANLLYARYGGWDQIPELQITAVLQSQNYWVSTTSITSKLGLNVMSVLLVNIDSRMGNIQLQLDKQNQKFEDQKRTLYAVVCVVVVLSFALALGLSVMITRPLQQLMNALVALVNLEFEILMKHSGKRIFHVTEIEDFQHSFNMLIRGLKAFSKFVPRDVALLTITGNRRSLCLNPHDSPRSVPTPSAGARTPVHSMLERDFVLVSRRNVTILFTDIVGFSSICENLSSEALLELLSEYLDAMCGVIQATSGTLDQFVGDCIVAFWNAPKRIHNHQIIGCKAVLQMQEELIRLDNRLESQNRPTLKFRAGLNTCELLVGNLGCTFRINYTCMGDGVNLASRLETTNKRLGTVVLVTEDTQKVACNQIYFRKIGNAKLSPTSSALVLYEPLFELDVSDDSQLISSGEINGSTSINVEGQLSWSISQSENSLVMTESQQRVLPPTNCSADSGLYASLVHRLFSKPPKPKRVSERITNGNNKTGGDTRECNCNDGNMVYYCWSRAEKSQLKRMVAFYHQGLLEFSHGNWKAAEKLFLSAMTCLRSRDGPSAFLMGLCQQYISAAAASNACKSPTKDIPISAALRANGSSTTAACGNVMAVIGSCKNVFSDYDENIPESALSEQPSNTELSPVNSDLF